MSQTKAPRGPPIQPDSTDSVQGGHIDVDHFGGVAGSRRGGDEPEMAAGLALMSSGELFATYQARIRRYILSMVHDPDEADDLTQDVFVQAHRRLGSLRDPDAVVSWLYRIATHVCYDRFRKWSRQPRPRRLELCGPSPTEQVPTRDTEPSLGRVLEQAEMSACVRGYLDELADDYRNVILLHDLKGLTSVEIAQMVGATVNTVKIRLHRARRKLEAVLATHCELSRDEEGVLVCEPTSSPVRAATGSAQSAQPECVSLPPVSSSCITEAPQQRRCEERRWQ